MKTYQSRIKEKFVNGITMYQPQIKRKNIFSFLNEWQALSMLIIYADENPQRSEIKFWTEDKPEAQLTLDRFAHNHPDVKLKQQ